MRTMTIDGLTAELARLREDVGGHAEVRIAHQPFHPFEYRIGDVVVADLNAPEDEADNPNAQPYYVVYIGEGEQLGQLPAPARRELEW